MIASMITALKFIPLCSLLAIPLALASSPVPAPPQDAMSKVKAFEFDATRGLATAFYETGKKYFGGGYRKESVHFMKRCLEIRPNNGPIRGLVNRLQNYDDPVWKKKRWRSPKAKVEKGFLRKVAQLDERYIKALVHFGNHSRKYKQPELQERSRTHYLRALDLHGGPYEIDKKGRLDLEHAAIPKEPTEELLKEVLVEINGQLYLRDSMLMAIQDVSSVREARGKHALVRTIDSVELAKSMVDLIDDAWEDFVEYTAQEPDATLGLFVFPDKDAYQAYCRSAGRSAHQMSAGFAHANDGFAVTFIQPGIDFISVHEAAHLFHFHSFHCDMPSWYDEGFATTFGGEGTMKREGGKLTTQLPLAANRLKELLAGFIPVDELLTREAVSYNQTDQDKARRFYAESWALFTYLNQTEDKRFRDRFDEWEGFALGSGFADGKIANRGDSRALFERVFEGVVPELETALQEWIASQLP